MLNLSTCKCSILNSKPVAIQYLMQFFFLNSLSLNEFATNEAIQCTEIFEYAQLLGNSMYLMPSFQVSSVLSLLVLRKLLFSRMNRFKGNNSCDMRTA